MPTAASVSQLDLVATSDVLLAFPVSVVGQTFCPTVSWRPLQKPVWS